MRWSEMGVISVNGEDNGKVKARCVNSRGG